MKILKTSLLTAMILSSLVACGGSSDNNNLTPTTGMSSEGEPLAVKSLSGMISTGNVFTGTVYVIDKNGLIAEQKINAKSAYEITLDEKAEQPYLIKAVSSVTKNPNDTWQTLYSYSESDRANVTELTTYAMNAMAPNKRLSTIFTDWKNASSNFDADTVNRYGQSTLADFADELQQAKVTQVPNIFTSEFKHDGTGMDKVLEMINIFLMCTGNSCNIDGKTNGQLQTGVLYTEQALQNILVNVFTDLNDLNNLTVRPQETKIQSATYDPASSRVASSFEDWTFNHLAKPASSAEFCEFYPKFAPLLPKGKIKNCSYSNGNGKFSVHNISADNKVLNYTVYRMTFGKVIPVAGTEPVPVTPPYAGTKYAKATRIHMENNVQVATESQTFSKVAIPADQASFCANDSSRKYAFVPPESSKFYPTLSCTYSTTDKKGVIVLQESSSSGATYNYSVQFSDNAPS